MDGGRKYTGNTPDFLWNCDSGINQKPLQTLPQSLTWHRHTFYAELTFPEQKGWFGNIKKPFSLHNAKPALSW